MNHKFSIVDIGSEHLKFIQEHDVAWSMVNRVVHACRAAHTSPGPVFVSMISQKLAGMADLCDALLVVE